MTADLPHASEEDLYRLESIGAFSHEVRTPLTSIRMVLELARRDSTGGDLVLDPELAAMLASSIDDLEQLADDLQEASRLERRKLQLSTGPCDLAVAVEAARELLAPKLVIAGDASTDVVGPWDARYLVRAIAAFAAAANRVGEGSGTVGIACGVTGESCEVVLTSGQPGGAPRDIAADAGFGFFRARQFVLAMGGKLEWDRRERYLEVRMLLPLGAR